MCLLHTHHPDTAFDYDDIADFHTHNPDGLGVMWLEDGVVRVVKALPKNDKEAWQFYQMHIQGKECVCHWRQKTHGLIDLENCHPYEVLPGIYLMHNGVLGHGNEADKTKSDSWHYARSTLAPMLAQYPDLLFNEGFQRMLAGDIGSGNRFVIMSPAGTVSINMPQIFHKGAQMSNNYAWTDPTRPKYNYSWTRGSYIPSTTVARAPLNPVPTGLPDWWYGEDDEYAVESAWVDDAIEHFFSCLDDAGLWDAYNAATYVQVEALADKLGEEQFYQYCDDIFEVPLTDDDVKWALKNPDMAAEPLHTDNQETRYDAHA